MKYNIKMLRKLSPYLPIFLLIFAIVGCTGLPVQSTSSQSTIKYRANMMAPKSHIADVDDMETDVTLHAKELNKSYKSRIYLLDSGDILDITVFEEPDLSMKSRVAEDGTIAYPLIGAIEVKGLTTQEAEKKLEKRLRDGEYLKNPQVAVKLNLEVMKRFSDKEVFVIGEVEKPQAIPILGKNITVLEAIAKAGGFTEFAAPNRSTVIRIEDGVEKTIKVDLNKAKKGDRSLDIILKQGDVVVVPETFF
jgi:polysaccharide biosynthesis/export protein